MARKRDEASPEDNENAPQENEIIPKPAVNGIISKPVVNGVGAPKKNRQFEEPVSFEEVIYSVQDKPSHKTGKYRNPLLRVTLIYDIFMATGQNNTDSIRCSCTTVTISF